MAEPTKRLKTTHLTTEEADSHDTKTKSNAETATAPNSFFFDGIKAVIIENGIGKTRVAILSEKLIKYGGQRHSKLQESTSHVFVAQNIKFERLPKLLGLGTRPVPEGVSVIRADWISKCLIEGKRIHNEPYLVNPPTDKASEVRAENITSDSISIEGSKVVEPPLDHKSEKSPQKWDPIPSTSQKAEERYNVNKVDETSDSDFVDSGDEGADWNQGASSRCCKVATSVINLSTSPEKIKDKWMCAGASTSQGVNHNQAITDQLQVLATSYANTKDQWRALGYKKAISSIKSYHKKIETKEECSKLPFVGEKLAKKIWEIVETGHLRRLDHMDPKMEAINLFSDVWGAGPKTAEIWVSKGLRTLDDLRKHGNLTKQQQIGLRYYEEFIDRMPREEAGRIGDTVKKAAEKINPGLLCVTCGSYRRGKATCGDVDVLVTHPDGKSHHSIMGQLLQELKKSGFLTDDLVSVDIQDQRKYMGVCRLPGNDTKHRRLDIIVVPYSEYGCAIVYFTGSDHFNRSMRLLAKKNGMALSEHTLKTGVVRKGGEKIYEGTPLPINSEKDVFDTLGLEYREPHERDW